MCRNIFRILLFYLSLFLTNSVISKAQSVDEFDIVKVAESTKNTPISQVLDLDFSFRKTDYNQVKMYVADALSPYVIVMVQDKNQLTMKGQIGKNGRGPGEFLKVSNLQLMGEEELLAYDNRLKRASVFNIESHEVGKMISLNVNRGNNPTELFATSGNAFFSREERFFRETDKSGQKRFVVLKKYDNDGELKQDSVLVKFDDDALVYRTSGGMSVNTMPAIGRKSIFRFYDNKIYHAWTGENRIDVYDYSGQKLNSIEPVGINRKEITDDDFEDFVKLESKLEGTRKSKLKPTIKKYIPDQWPYFDDFLIDDKGQIWIAESVHMGEKMRSWFIIKASDNKLVGKVQLPANFTPHQIKSGYIAGQHMDDNFNASIQLYKVTN